MNVDPKLMGNGSIASSSNSSSSKSYLANGVSPDGPYNYLNNDFSFPPEGVPSLRLPLVVVFSPSILFMHDSYNSSLLRECLEVFLNKLSFYGYTFGNCLLILNANKKKTNLVLN